MAASIAFSPKTWNWCGLRFAPCPAKIGFELKEPKARYGKRR
jgi:hypothetical protein